MTYEKNKILEDLLKVRDNTKVAERIAEKAVELSYESMMSGIALLFEKDSTNRTVLRAISKDEDMLRKKLETFAEIKKLVEAQLGKPSADTVINGLEKMLIFEEHIDNLAPEIKRFMAEKNAVEAYGLSYIMNYASQEFLGEVKKEISNMTDIKKKFMKKYEEASAIATMQALAFMRTGEQTGMLISAEDSLSAYAYLESLGRIMTLREAPIFSFFSVAPGTYYPKERLDLEALESLVDKSKYKTNEQHNRREQVVKLKKGNSDEKNKVRAKVSVDNEGITLKYLVAGIYGEKIDVVLRFKDGKLENDFGVQHLDYKHAEFKTYRDGEKKIFLRGKEGGADLADENIRWLADTQFINQFMIDEGGKARLNTAGIGGEALKYACEYIEQHYQKIMDAAIK